MALVYAWHVLMENIVQNCSHIKKNWINNYDYKVFGF